MIDRSASQKRLLWALAVNLTFFGVEVAGGILTRSLALLADAGHMFGDVAALTIALTVLRLARRAPSGKRTFGLLRAEVLGAFVNGAGLMVITAFIFKEAWDRIGSEPVIAAPAMLVVAVLGLAANLASAMILWKDRKADINIHGAFLHMMADSLGSVGVIVAGAIIWATGWYTADVLASVAVGCIILWNTWHFTKQSVSILLESTPKDVEFKKVKSALIGIPHVEDIHDLHIWTITSGMPVLTAHMRISDECSDSGHWPVCLAEAKDLIRNRFGISHSTIEVESCSTQNPGAGCPFDAEDHRI